MPQQSNHTAPVAQLDRALPSEGKGRTFESSRVRQISRKIILLHNYNSKVL
jgi:hypothetical protein